MRSTIQAPVIPGLVVREDAFGHGRTTEGVEYRTFEIGRPRRDIDLPTRLAELTIYADPAIPVIVTDRLTSASAADLRAAGKLRDYIAQHVTLATHTGYRYL